jgi:arginine exporter protein ArgO
MKRNTTVLALCGLCMLADLLCFQQTFGTREILTRSLLTLIFAIEVVVMTMTAYVAFVVFRKTYARQKKPASRQAGSAILQPLRRLFVSVWP